MGALTGTGGRRSRLAGIHSFWLPEQRNRTLRRHRTSLSAAVIVGGALLIASVTGAARPPVTSTGPGWLAGPGGHALEKVGRDIAVLPARPGAVLARKLSADVVSAMKAPMPPSEAALYKAGLAKWREAARFMVHKHYAAAAADLKAGTRDVSAVTTGLKAARGATGVMAATGTLITSGAPAAVALPAAKPVKLKPTATPTPTTPKPTPTTPTPTPTTPKPTPTTPTPTPTTPAPTTPAPTPTTPAPTPTTPAPTTPAPTTPAPTPTPTTPTTPPPTATPSLSTASSVYYEYGTGLSSFAISPDSLQNIYLMFVEIDPSTTVTVQSVSSSRVTWTRAVQVFSGGKDFEMWTGIPTSLGDSTVSFTFTGSVSQSNVETGRQQFQSSLSAPHWTVTGGWDAYPSGNAIIYPALQVAPGGGYWAYGKTTNVGSAGSTPGFAYDVTPQANVVAYSTSATGLVSPTAPTLPGSGTSVGVSVSAS